MMAGVTKDIHAELVFWSRVPDQKVEVDFTKSSLQDCMTTMKRLDQKHAVLIHDLRGRETDFTLERNGFQYLWHNMPELAHVDDPACVKSIIIPQTEELVRQVTGATKTVTFTHRVRCLKADEQLLADNRAPAHSVHSDFTTVGALRNLELVIKDTAERNRLLKDGHVLAINVWRPLKTVQRDPLTVCDWTTVEWRQDQIANRLVLPGGWNELGKYAFHPGQQWYYLGGQQPQEVLMFKQFDSQQIEAGGMTVPHTAFVDPGSVDGPPRESIEIKMFAFL